MNSHVLEKLFNSVHLAKIIRLFVLNAEKSFVLKEISRRSRAIIPTVRREISLLERIGFVKKVKTGKIVAYTLNTYFTLLQPLKSLVLAAMPVGDAEIGKTLRSTGTLKLLLVGGFFMQSDDGRVDMLIVGDGIKRVALDRKMREIEAEIGKELAYTVLTTDEFTYRVDMCDKFISDIFEKPHRKIINRLNVD